MFRAVVGPDGEVQIEAASKGCTDLIYLNHEAHRSLHSGSSDHELGATIRLSAPRRREHCYPLTEYDCHPLPSGTFSAYNHTATASIKKEGLRCPRC